MQISRICGRKGTSFLLNIKTLFGLFLLNVHTCLNQIENQ